MDNRAVSEYFSPEYIKTIYETKIRFSAGVGIDRSTWREFEKAQPDYYNSINTRILSDSYTFSPYLEKLVSKGRNKYPRVISIPTIRDKIILTILNKYLQNEFSKCISRTLPNQRVKKIIQFFETCSDSLSVVRTDFTNFYGSIEHHHLLFRLKNVDTQILSLITKAITNPTVPPNTPNRDREKFVQRYGIPQGLPISNILAEIYMYDLDGVIGAKCDFYDRYVDDIIAFTHKPVWLMKLMEDEFKNISLSFNKDKTTINKIGQETLYLGYSVAKNRVSVKKTSFEKFLSSFDKLIAKLKADRRIIRSELEDKKGNEYSKKIELLKSNFIEDLNIKVTGAYYDNKRYGWVFYFSEINDLSLLYRIDAYIEKKITLLRMKKYLKEIKKMSRAYFHIKGGTSDKYSHNFNVTSSKEMLLILKRRGLVHEWETLKISEIKARYHKYVGRKLSELDEDLGKVY